MARCVVKFGGSNFRNAEDVKKILGAVALYEKPPVVVVSAFYGVTDELLFMINSLDEGQEAIEKFIQGIGAVKGAVLDRFIDNARRRSEALNLFGNRLEDLSRILLGAHYIGEVPFSVRERILSYGERLSSLVLTEVLNHHGIRAVECLPEDIGLVADGSGGDGVVDFAASGSSVKEGLSGDCVCVVPGFYAHDRNGDVILLGRGGSDYSAAAIARCIGAESLDVWKDVHGYRSADPRIVDSPGLVKRLGYVEAAELSYFGAHILHPRTVEPLEDVGIPVRVFNIDSVGNDGGGNDDSGGAGLNPLSVIGPDSLAPEGLKSVTFSDDFAVLSLIGAGVGIRPGILARVTGALDSAGVNIKSVVTSQTAINVYLDEGDLDEAVSVVEKQDLLSLSRVVPRKKLSVVALVGRGLGSAPEIAENMLLALDGAGIHFEIFSVGASDAAAYAVIPRERRIDAVRALHERFFKLSR